MTLSTRPEWAPTQEAYDELLEALDLEPMRGLPPPNAYWENILESWLDDSIHRITSSVRWQRNIHVLQIGGAGGTCTQWHPKHPKVEFVWAFDEQGQLAPQGTTRSNKALVLGRSACQP